MAGRKLKDALLTVGELAQSPGTELYTELCIRQQVSLSKDPYGIYSICFTGDAQQLAVGFGNGAVQVLNPEKGTVIRELSPGHRARQAVTAMSYFPKHWNILVTAGADGIISVYNTDTGWEALTINGTVGFSGFLQLSTDLVIREGQGGQMGTRRLHTSRAKADGETETPPNSRPNNPSEMGVTVKTGPRQEHQRPGAPFP
ncbi:hypothetical protein chiPu_0029429, partial [Chiloscyllium punctatum]|nr:hypothetical protein [Chiloscyllium punctatum]